MRNPSKQEYETTVVLHLPNTICIVLAAEKYDHNEIGKMKTIRKRQVKKNKENSEQKHSDSVAVSETLNSADLENLI